MIRQADGRYQVAVIRPAGRSAMALPKGHIDPGETAVEAAAREVNEETGLTVEFDRPLGDISYVYRFQRQTIFKLVSFFLFRWASGEVGAITPAMRREVQSAWWVPLETAATQLSYPGERQMVVKALHGLSAKD